MSFEPWYTPDMSLERRPAITITTPTDFSLFETLHSHGWRHLLPFYPNDSTNSIARIQRLGSGTVVRISVAEGPASNLMVEADGGTPDEVEGIIRRILQLDRSLSDFHEYCSATPGLARISLARQGRMLCSPTLFEDCLKVILTTNTTWAQTKGMVKRLVDAYGSPWPTDPTLKAFPTPEQIAAVPVDDFAATVRAGYRAQSLHGLAVDVAEGRTDLDALRDPSLTSDDVLKRLLALRGIGPYGAACLLLYLGRGDRVNVDSWARTLVGQELGRKVTDKEVVAFFEPHGKWRGLVYSFYPWKERGAGATADVAA